MFRILSIDHNVQMSQMIHRGTCSRQGGAQWTERLRWVVEVVIAAGRKLMISNNQVLLNNNRRQDWTEIWILALNEKRHLRKVWRALSNVGIREASSSSTKRHRSPKSSVYKTKRSWPWWCLTLTSRLIYVSKTYGKSMMQITTASSMWSKWRSSLNELWWS